MLAQSKMERAYHTSVPFQPKNMIKQKESIPTSYTDNIILPDFQISLEESAGLKWFYKIALTAPDPNHIQVINTKDQAERAGQEILKITEKVPYCGLDCEWKPERFKGARNPTAMLQVAVYDVDQNVSKSYLFRLLNDNMKTKSVLEFINSTKILKLGVGISTDNKRLVTENYMQPNNQNYFDLREVPKANGQSRTNGLKGLTAQFLNRTREKVKVLTGPRTGSRSNWLARNLAIPEIMYAADDALSAVQIFAVFLREHGEENVLNIVNQYHNDKKYLQTKFPGNRKLLAIIAREKFERKCEMTSYRNNTNQSFPFANYTNKNSSSLASSNPFRQLLGVINHCQSFPTYANYQSLYYQSLYYRSLPTIPAYFQPFTTAGDAYIPASHTPDQVLPWVYQLPWELSWWWWIQES